MTNDSVKTPFHPAYSVSNIKNYVQITLETENVHYASWVELFLNTARASDVVDHIEPPKNAEAWDRLKDIFVDNQHSRAVLLEQQFSSIHMDNYPDVSSYCQALKMIVDQLANVGAPVSDTRLVLQMVTKVSDGYDGIASIIQQRDPLPSFYKARSMMALEEKRRANVSGSTGTALVSHNAPAPASDSRSKSTITDGSSNSNKGKGGRNNRKNNRGKNGNDSNQQSSGSSGSGGRGNQQQPGTWTWVPMSPWQVPQQQGWTVPPCPYPTTGWTAPPPSRGPGILGPRPNQAFIAQPGTTGATQGAFVPTDIAAVMQSLSLQQPDEAYYMDTGASSHMTSNNGTLSSYSKLSSNRHIVVGNGHMIPIVGHGAMSLPPPNQSLTLNNVLHVPNIIKNLVLVRKFTTDNLVSVEFDPLGFTVKDLKTGKPIMRSNSTGDLYSLHPAPPPHPPAYAHALTALDASTWHGRLGHPGPDIFNSLCAHKKHSVSSFQ
ncbi:uncharacterized protein LOC141612916 [Silene latifolia]|uniref:uncharacterized protein LOC141612916 n=1 Tax=Silene latifolia TaxID=37657 RepID=UPI003D76EE53